MISQSKLSVKILLWTKPRVDLVLTIGTARSAIGRMQTKPRAPLRRASRSSAPRPSRPSRKTTLLKSSPLAIDGGPKAVTNRLQGWPQFTEKGIAQVEAVLRSGKVSYWTGRRGMEFEKRFAEW